MKRFLRMIFTVCVLACALNMSIAVYAAAKESTTKANEKATEKATENKATIKKNTATGKAKKNQITLKGKLPTEKNKKRVINYKNDDNGYLIIGNNSKARIDKNFYVGPIINKGKLTITKGIFKGTILNYGTLTIKGGTFEKSETTIVGNGGDKYGTETDINIINCKELKVYGGTFKGRIWNFGKAVFSQKDKKLKIHNADGKDTINNYIWGELEIKGGIFGDKKPPQKDVCLIKNYGNLTIGKKNSSIQCYGAIYNYGKTTISDGTFTGHKDRLLLRNEGEMIIKGGKFKSQTHVIDNRKDLTISNGSFLSDYQSSGFCFALFNYGGTIKITGGTFSAKKYSIGSTNDAIIIKEDASVSIQKASDTQWYVKLV